MKSAALLLGQSFPLHWKNVYGFLVPQALTAPWLSPLPHQGDPHPGDPHRLTVRVMGDVMSCTVHKIRAL
jgi:hypothetical protein